MSLDIKGERNRRHAIRMVCEMLKIDDKKLKAFIENGELPKEAPKADPLAKARAAKLEKNKK